MAIRLTSVDQTVTMVHTSDPDVQWKEKDRGEPSWVAVTECFTVADTATRVTVRPLNGRDILDCWGIQDQGKQAGELLRRGVVAINGKAADEAAIAGLSWDVLGPLARVIEAISRGPTAAHR